MMALRRSALQKLASAVVLLLLSTVSHAEVSNIDSATATVLIERGVRVIDVRREDEWQATGVIPGSHLLTFFDASGSYDVQAWLRTLEAVVDTEDPLLLVCARGVRSDRIARLLNDRLGYVAVHNLEAGIAEWLREGRPVVAYKKQSAGQPMQSRQP